MFVLHIYTDMDCWFWYVTWVTGHHVPFTWLSCEILYIPPSWHGMVFHALSVACEHQVLSVARAFHALCCLCASGVECCLCASGVECCLCAWGVVLLVCFMHWVLLVRFMHWVLLVRFMSHSHDCPVKYCTYVPSSWHDLHAELECRVWGAKQQNIGTTSWKTSWKNSSDSTATLGQRCDWVLDLIRTVGTTDHVHVNNKITPIACTYCMYCMYTQEYSTRGACTLSLLIYTVTSCVSTFNAHTHMHLHLTFTYICMYYSEQYWQ